MSTIFPGTATYPFTPIVRDYTPATANADTGGATEFVPGGSTSVIIEVWGPGGGGGGANYPDSVGGGGGSGAYCKATVPVVSDDWGMPISVSIPALRNSAGGVHTPSPGNPGSPGSANDLTSAIDGVDCLNNINLYAGSGGGGQVVLTGAGSPGAGGESDVGDVYINGNSGVGSTGGASVHESFGAGGEGGSQIDGDDGGPGHVRFSWI